VVLLMEVIEHILPEQYEQALARIASFVAPGGRLIVSTPNNEDLEHAQVFCPLSKTYFHPWQHMRSFTPASLGETLARHGLERESVVLADFSNDAALIAELRTLRASQAVADQARQTHAQNLARLARQASALRALAQQLDRDTSPWRSLLRCFAPQHRRPEAAAELAGHAEALAQLAQGGDSHQPITAPAMTTTDAQGISQRIGKESTIVFVARKPHHPA
jgi:hypothetical protein